MIRKKKVIVFLITCSLISSQCTYTKAVEVSNTNINCSTEITDVRKQDDFYNAINKDWLNTSVIGEGEVSNSSTDEIENRLKEQKKNIIDELIKNKNDYSENSDERKIINLYENYINTKVRNEEGINGIRFIIDNLNSINDINQLKDLEKNNIINPLIKYECSVDVKDSTKYALYINPTRLTLTYSDEYINPDESSKERKEIYSKYYKDIFKLCGYSESESNTKVENIFKFENIIAQFIKTREEALKDDSKNSSYNVVTIDELESMAPNLKIKEQMENLEISNANKIILTQPNWLKELNNLYKNENLQIIKDYIEINNITSFSSYLTDEFRKCNSQSINELLGTSGEHTVEELAIANIDSNLDMVFGKIYVNKYFDSKTKNDIEEVIKNIVSEYKTRLENIDWMTPATKENAIRKLDKLKVNAAYPDKWDDYSSLEIKSFDEGGSLIQNIININNFKRQMEYKKINTSVDPEEFICAPQTVNAFYNPNNNSITIPAGILQSPIYNKDASVEANYGAIGVIIGHEISHAFDTTGAKFDCDGNLSNWWTEEDYSKFKEKAQKVSDFYSLIKADNGNYVNGNLTVGENIADISGMACVLDILKKIDNPNYKEFFESYAGMYREKLTPQYAEYCLSFDVHSPGKVRVNAVLGQFDEFYKTYGISENDKMYIRPEDRLQIW
ncbi:MAG: M13 family metallopeptidase [Clostridiaceae bacterium]|nr:M13 family metallopeptidase [Clostridiaceae bacterium]